MANQDPSRRLPVSLSADTLRRLTAVARSAALGAFGNSPPSTDNTQAEIRRRIASVENRLRKTREAAARTEEDRRTLARILLLLNRSTALAARGWSEPLVAAGLALEMAQSHVGAGIAVAGRRLEQLKEAVRMLETSAENSQAAQSVTRAGLRSPVNGPRANAPVSNGVFERRGNVLRYVLKIPAKVSPAPADTAGETKNK